MSNELHTMPLKCERLLSSRRASSMRLDEFGAYMRLLCFAWLEGGSLPADMSEVRDALGRDVDDATWERIKSRVVERMFREENGRLVNETEAAIYQETREACERRADHGRAGAAQRWRNARALPEHCPTNANGMASKAKAKAIIPPPPPLPGGGGSVEAEKPPPETTKPPDPPPKRPRTDGPAAIHDREVPEFLRTASFANDTIAALFNDWLAERRQRRQYATARACREAMAKLSGYPPAVQETALRDSIANGWQGIFPDRTRPGGGAGPPKPIQHLAPTEAHKKALAEHMAKPQRF